MAQRHVFEQSEFKGTCPSHTARVGLIPNIFNCLPTRKMLRVGGERQAAVMRKPVRLS